MGFDVSIGGGVEIGATPVRQKSARSDLSALSPQSGQSSALCSICDQKNFWLCSSAFRRAPLRSWTLAQRCNCLMRLRSRREEIPSCTSFGHAGRVFLRPFRAFMRVPAVLQGLLHGSWLYTQIPMNKCHRIIAIEELRQRWH